MSGSPPIDNPIPTDGRPQPYLSNWPAPPPDGWAFYLAVIYQTLLTLICLTLFARYLYHWNTFPISLQSRHLIATMLLTSPLAGLSYTHCMLLPSLPCWAHILLTVAPYIPYAASAMAETVRLFLLYNAQFYMARGEKDNWFVRKKDILRGYRIELAVISLAVLATSGVLFSRFLLTEPSVLVMPMSQLRCSSLTTTQVRFLFFCRLKCRESSKADGMGLCLPLLVRPQGVDWADLHERPEEARQPGQRRQGIL